MVEHQTPEREVGGSILTQVAICILEQDTFTSQKSTGNTQEAVAPSRHDSKIVNWDVKPQPKQTNKQTF